MAPTLISVSLTPTSVAPPPPEAGGAAAIDPVVLSPEQAASVKAPNSPRATKVRVVWFADIIDRVLPLGPGGFALLRQASTHPEMGGETRLRTIGQPGCQHHWGFAR